MQSNMNQLTTYNNLNDGLTSRRYTGFPLNSTLVSSYTPDTIRSIINHAAAGKPYTTSVWIRISRVGIQISAQDPQIARTRIPVFIPIGVVHDIFMQPNINNVICVVYDEVKSNMKGVLLYVVHPTDTHLLRDDFRLAKQSSYAKGVENPLILDGHPTESNRLFSPTSQQSNEIYRNGKTNRQQSPKRILYVRDNEIGANKEIATSSAQPSLPQLSYTPFKGSYHSSRDDSAHRRHKSPRKPKTGGGGQSGNKPSSDNGSKHRRKYRSRSPQKQVKPPLSGNNNSQEFTQEQTNQQQENLLLQQEQQQQIAAWQTAQQVPMVPMGIYNRYVPKIIPLQTGETIKTTVSPSNTNGQIIAQIHPQNGINGHSSTRSPSRSRSISPKRQDQHHQHHRNRPSSAQNGEASAVLVQSSHHHYHHHHRRHHMNGHNHSSSKPETTIYNTISHSSRAHSKYLPITNHNNNNNNTDNENETKQYLKQLIDDMQAMKLEMNKIRVASSSVGTTRGRCDSLRINLKELRHDIDAIRARMAMTSRISKQ